MTDNKTNRSHRKLLYTFLMLLSLMTFMSLAVNALDDDQGINTTKTVTVRPDGNYQIDISVFTEGLLNLTVKDADLVLVIDQSGSMNNAFGSGHQMVYANSSGNFPSYGNNNNKYIFDINTNTYISVSRIGTSTNWMGANNITYNPKTSVGSAGTQFYWATSVTNLEATRTAINQFVEKVYAHAISTGANHRMSMVGFAAAPSSGANTEILTVTGTSRINYMSATNTHYHDSLMNVNSSGNINTKINQAIGFIHQGGYTATDTGIDMASKVFAQHSVDPNRKRIVVVFTDGKPQTNASNFDTIANSAIANSKLLKDQAIEVYSIGIMTEADQTIPPNQGNIEKDKINRFMHFITSNYPNATSLSSPVLPYAADNYYHQAHDPLVLAQAFDQILYQAVTSVITGETIINGTIRDIIDPAFKLTAIPVLCTTTAYPSGQVTHIPLHPDTTSSGTSYTYTPDGPIGGGGIFEINNITLKPVAFQNNLPISGNRVDIRLVVESAFTFGGNNVSTNGEGSGVYGPGGGKREDFPIPKVNLPINYNLLPKDSAIYVGDTSDLGKLLGVVSDTHGTTYVPNGINNKYVDITYTIKQGTQTIKQITVPAGTALDYTLFTLPQNVSPTECTVYTMDCAISSVSVDPAPIGAPATNWSTTVNGTIHVYYPTIRFTDKWVDYGSSNNLNERVALIGWADPISGHLIAPTYLAPNLTHQFWYSTDDNVPTTSNANKINNPSAFLILELTNFEIKAYNNGFDITQYCIFLNGNDHQSIVDGLHHFTIYLNYFDLLINKTVTGEPKPDQSFIFKIVCKNSGGSVQYTLYEFLTPDNFSNSTATKRLKDLDSRYTYTITELTSWSWRYTKTAPPADPIVGIANAVQVGGIMTASVSFTNNRTNDKWLSGDNYCTNRFGNPAIYGTAALPPYLSLNPVGKLRTKENSI